MTVLHHVSTDPDPQRRGRDFGTSRAAEVDATCTAYLGLFRRHAGLERADVLRRGAAVHLALREHDPAAATEIVGIAEGAAQPVDLLMALNARTELLAGLPECTVVADAHSGTLAQNWDYHPDVRPDRVLWSAQTEQGWFTTLTEAGLLGKVGLNDRGLGVALNVLSSARDGGEPGVPVHVLLRQVLERCPSVADAVQLLTEAPVSSSNAVTLVGPASVADPSTRIMTCEVTPAGVRVIEAEAGTLTHTNHCRHPDLVADDLTPAACPDTLTRLARACELMGGGVDPDGVRVLLGDHASDHRGICRHDDGAPDLDRSVTLASVVMVPARPALWVSDGAPCTAEHEAVTLPWAPPH